MADSRANRPGRTRLMLAAPWALSIALHALIVAGAAFVVWNVTRSPTERPQTIVSFSDPSLAPLTAATEATDASETTPVPPPPPPDILAPPPLKSTDAATMLDEFAPPDTPQLTRAEATDIDAVRETRRFPEVRFGGLGASNAERLVYVVDGSGSMISTLPIVVAELKKSLRKLSPSQQFQVVFFQSGVSSRENPWIAAPHPADDGVGHKMARYIYASDRYMTRTEAWLDSVEARGRSNPIPALEVAIALQPDAIFLLSTAITGAGEWEQDKTQILERLDQLNPRDRRTGRRPTVIKTIGFLDEDPTGLLREIGRLHGGEDGYNFISRKELDL